MQNDFCSFCFAPCDDLFEPIEEETRKSLALLLSLNTKIRGESQVACTNCSTRLRGYVKFKSILLQTEASVQSFRLANNGVLDMRQVHLQNKSKATEVSTKNFGVCRFCLKQATVAYITLVPTEKELTSVTIMMRESFPGLTFGTVSGYVMCIACHDALEASYSFVTSLNLESDVKEEDVVEEIDIEEGPDLKPLLLKSEALVSENGGVDLNLLKDEGNLCTAYGDHFEETVDVKVEVPVHECEREYKLKIEADGSSARGLASAAQSETTYNAPREENSRCQELGRNPSKVSMYKCETCSYKTKSKKNYNQHMVIHKKPSKITMYQCLTCFFQTKHKERMDYHKLKHKNSTEVQIYRCNECSYVTNRIRCFNQHILSHKDPSEVTLYKCESCMYETHTKRNYSRHIRRHKNASEVTQNKSSS